MFGLFERYDETAQATVLGIKLINNRQIGEHVRSKYEFVLEIKSAQGEAFRTTTQLLLPLMTRVPQVGEPVKAMFNPKNHKVKLEFKGDKRYDLNMLVEAQRADEQKRQEAILSSPPGTPIPPPSSDYIKEMFKRPENTGSFE